MPSAQAPAPVRQLFGGAISASVPVGYIDASRIRDVPDHQEVFIDTATDSSFIVELLEPQDLSMDIHSAARQHLEQLARDNEATSDGCTIISERDISDSLLSSSISGAKAVVISSTQCISKYNEAGDDAKNTVGIYMGLIQLGRVSTDVLITFNQTLNMGVESSSRLQFGGETDSVFVVGIIH
ncbi:hypothetical protein BASA83_011110 [Batrachochytrium salamandrivorans]|nr:hypothetical protein BASA83_011110 [Batrachochytrium salamandrivorans]